MGLTYASLPRQDGNLALHDVGTDMLSLRADEGSKNVDVRGVDYKCILGSREDDQLAKHEETRRQLHESQKGSGRGRDSR